MDIVLNNENIEQYINNLKERECSENTIKTYKITFKLYQKLHGNILNKTNLLDYKEYLLKQYKPKTVNLRITCLNQFIKYYAEQQKKEEYKQICIKYVKVQSKPYLNNVISNEEYTKMCSYLYNANKKYYFIIKFLGQTGARISELIQFDMNGLKNGFYDIKSKGGKIRRIYIPKELKEDAIEFFKNEKSTLFRNRSGNRISTRGIAHQLKKYAEILNIQSEKVHPHSFRHMFAINFLKMNNDITLLADLLGHSNLETTSIYLRRTEEEQHAIINSINW